MTMFGGLDESLMKKVDLLSVVVVLVMAFAAYYYYNLWSKACAMCCANSKISGVSGISCTADANGKCPACT